MAGNLPRSRKGKTEMGGFGFRVGGGGSRGGSGGFVDLCFVEVMVKGKRRGCPPSLPSEYLTPGS